MILHIDVPLPILRLLIEIHLTKKSNKVIFDLYYLKFLSGALYSDQFKKALAEDVKEELSAVVVRIIQDSCSDTKYNIQKFQRKDIPIKDTWK